MVSNSSKTKESLYSSPCKPGVVCLISGFTSLSDENFSCGPHLDMTLAVVGTLSTNKQSNKQKETTNTQFQHDVLRDIKYGNGFWVNFIELEAQKTGSRDQKKRNTSLSYQKTPTRSNKDKN